MSTLPEGEACTSEPLDAEEDSRNPNFTSRNSYALPIKLRVTGSAGKKVPTELSTRQKAKVDWYLKFNHKIRTQPIKKLITE